MPSFTSFLLLDIMAAADVVPIQKRAKKYDNGKTKIL